MWANGACSPHCACILSIVSREYNWLLAWRTVARTSVGATAGKSTYAEWPCAIANEIGVVLVGDSVVVHRLSSICVDWRCPRTASRAHCVKPL